VLGMGPLKHVSIVALNAVMYSYKNELKIDTWKKRSKKMLLSVDCSEFTMFVINLKY